MARRVCRRCLTMEIPDGAELAATIQEWIRHLPEEQRADRAVVEQRLLECRQCDALADGTCMLCGCYVELRASKRNMRCPALPAKWTQEN